MVSAPPPRPGGLPPAPVMTAAAVIAVAVAALVLTTALRQPWLGLSLTANPDGAVEVLRSTGPAVGIAPGTTIESVANSEDRLKLRALDVAVEPDGAMGTYETYREFLDRQDRLSRMIQSGEIRVVTGDGGSMTLVPGARGRPFSSLPPDFWVQLVVGLIAWLVSAAVFAFRPREASARYLLLSGAATLTFSPAAAIYSTRELALDGTLFRWINDLNFLGGSLFAASFVALLLHYPRQVEPRWAGIAVVALYVVWFVAQQLGCFESMTVARRLLVLIGVGATFVLAGVHWFQTRSKPLERAALQWFLLSWLLGTSAFCLFILLPQLFGVDTSPLQGYSFLLFLLVYGGLAFGITRYRLFELGHWWRRALGWAFSILLLVLLDMLFLIGLGLSSAISLSLALLICGVVWLPVRGWIWQKFRTSRESHPGVWFGRVMDVALARSEETRLELWQDLLAERFSPMATGVETTQCDQVTLADDGLSMIVPGAGGMPALRLEFASNGRRLFNPDDTAVAAELVQALDHALDSRKAYETGVAEERVRIARDIHDNIGAQLLAALHSRETERKDAKIRESLDDLRSVINNSPATPLTIDETFAELRAESAERLESAGIRLDWQGDDSLPMTFAPSAIHAIRSAVREALSNVIRHSGASAAVVELDRCDDSLHITVGDDGIGCAGDAPHGNGLQNIRARLSRLGGSMEILPSDLGTHLLLRIPLTRRDAPTS